MLRDKLWVFTKLPTEYSWKIALQLYLEQFSLFLGTVWVSSAIMLGLMLWKKYYADASDIQIFIFMLMSLLVAGIALYIFRLLHRVNLLIQNQETVRELLRSGHQSITLLSDLGYMMEQQLQEIHYILDQEEVQAGASDHSIDEIEQLSLEIRQLITVSGNVSDSVHDMIDSAETVADSLSRDSAIVEKELKNLDVDFSNVQNRLLSLGESYLEIQRSLERWRDIPALANTGT